MSEDKPMTVNDIREDLEHCLKRAREEGGFGISMIMHRTPNYRNVMNSLYKAIEFTEKLLDMEIHNE